MNSLRLRSTWSVALRDGRAAIAAIVLAAASGCCYCGTPLYDIEAHQTWNKLEHGVWADNISVDGEQTGVSIQLPNAFGKPRYEKKPIENNKYLYSDVHRPGLSSGEVIALRERVQPPGIDLPGLRFTYEMFYRDDQGRELPVYAYLSVLAKGTSERTTVKNQLLQAAKPTYPNANWEKVQLEGSKYEVEKLSLVGPQQFVPAGNDDIKNAIDLPGQLDLYLVGAEHANVLVGFRGPTDIAERVSLFEAAEASIASIKSEKPKAAIAATTGDQPAAKDYVQVTGTNVELVPPAGFTPSTTMSGFEKPSGANIAVLPQTHAYSALVKSYQADTLKGYGINVLQQEDVTVGGAPALLLLLERAMPKQTYWNLVFGDATGSFVITATLAPTSDEAEKQALRTALLTARKKP